MEVAWYQDAMNGLKTKTFGETEGKPVQCWGWVTTSTKNQLILTGNMRDCNPALPTPWGTRRRSIIQEGSDTCTEKRKHSNLTKAGNRMPLRSWKGLKGAKWSSASESHSRLIYDGPQPMWSPATLSVKCGWTNPNSNLTLVSNTLRRRTSMNLIHWIRFGSCEVRRLNRVKHGVKARNARPYHVTEYWRHRVQCRIGW